MCNKSIHVLEHTVVKADFFSKFNSVFYAAHILFVLTLLSPFSLQHNRKIHEDLMFLTEGFISDLLCSLLLCTDISFEPVGCPPSTAPSVQIPESGADYQALLCGSLLPWRMYCFFLPHNLSHNTGQWGPDYAREQHSQMSEVLCKNLQCLPLEVIM